jgi:mono/diheme cytochrome c family protein
MMKSPFCATASLLGRGLTSALLAASIAAPAFAQGDTGGGVSRTSTGAVSGEQIYRATCAACHMQDGKGGTGAATIPALAGNPKLAAAAYPITIVLTGKGAMPSFVPYLTPAQMAQVLTFVRTSFGNSYTKPVTEAEVSAMLAARKK